MNLRFISSFEHADTTEENLEELFNKRQEQLLGYSRTDDLTPEEIVDIKEYRSGIGNIKRFKNVDDFLNDLNE